MTGNYSELQGHLQRVRWAWKRTAALQGLAMTCIEAMGMFALFVLVDHFYQMPQSVRTIVLALMTAAIAILFKRHVIAPLTRKISDDQVALYIEERQQENDGALLSATVFGAQGSETGQSTVYDFI